MPLERRAYPYSAFKTLLLLRRTLTSCKPLSVLQHTKRVGGADAPRTAAPASAALAFASGPASGAVAIPPPAAAPAGGAAPPVAGPDAALGAAAVGLAAAAAPVERQHRRKEKWYLLSACNGRTRWSFLRVLHFHYGTVAAASPTVRKRKAADTEEETGQDTAGERRGEGNGIEAVHQREVAGREEAQRKKNSTSGKAASLQRTTQFPHGARLNTAAAAEAGTGRAGETAAAAAGGAETSAGEDGDDVAEATSTAEAGEFSSGGGAGKVRIARFGRTAAEVIETRSFGEQDQEAASGDSAEEAKCGRHSREAARGEDAAEPETAATARETDGSWCAGGPAEATGVTAGGDASTAETAEEAAAPDVSRERVGAALAGEEVRVAGRIAAARESAAAAETAGEARAASCAVKAGKAADSGTAPEAGQASPATDPGGREDTSEARKATAVCSVGTREGQTGKCRAASRDKADGATAAAGAASVAAVTAEDARNAATRREGEEAAGATATSLALSVSEAAARNTRKVVNVVNRVRRHDVLNSLVASGLDWEGRGVVLLRVREMKKLFSFPFFRVLPGERLALRVEHVKQRWGEKKCRAACIGTSKPSEDETTPPCGHFDEFCGGCSVLHLRYSRQLQEKQQLLREALNQHFLPAQQLQQHLLHQPDRQERQQPQRAKRRQPREQELEHAQKGESEQDDVQQHVKRQPQQHPEENKEEGGEELEKDAKEQRHQRHSEQEVAALMLPIPSPTELGFHNRAEYVFLLKNGPRVGHYHIDSPDVTDIASCPKATSAVRAVYRVLRRVLLRSIRDGSLSIFNALTGAGLLKGLLLRSAVTDGKAERVLVCFICQQTRLLPAALSRVAAAIANDSRCATHVGGIVAVPMNSPGKPARAEDEVLFFGDRHITQTVAGTQFLITARTSFPTHALLLEDLWRVVLRMAEPQPHQVVWDFFAGCGLFSLLLAPQCKHVFAFDPRAENVAEMRANFEENDRRNATAHLAELSCRHTLRALAAALPASRTKNSWDTEEEAAGLQQQLLGLSSSSSNRNITTSSRSARSPAELMEPAAAGRRIFRRWGIPPTLADAAVIKKADKKRQEALAQEALLLLEEEEETTQWHEEEHDAGAPFRRERPATLWDEETDVWTAATETADVPRDGAATAGGNGGATAAAAGRAGATTRGAVKEASVASVWRTDHAPPEADDSDFAERPPEQKGSQLHFLRPVAPPDLLLLQPSRLGCEKALRAWLRRVSIPKIIYLSRYPPSMLRDISPLAYLGYTLRYIQPLDMFPHTANLMCAALLTHSQAK